MDLLEIKKQAIYEASLYVSNIKLDHNYEEKARKEAFKEGFINGSAFMQTWTNPNENMPQPERKIIFKLKSNGEKRIGIFLPKDQWGRENIFCDGAFHSIEKVAGWIYVPD